MVEQDLIISRALVELYKQPKIKEALVFCFKIESTNPIYADFLHFKKLLQGILAIEFSLSLIEKQNIQASERDFSKYILSSRDGYFKI